MPTKKAGRKTTNARTKKASPKRAAGQRSNKVDAVSNDDLAAKIKQLKEKDASANQNDISARYDIACICKDIMDGHGNRYGKRAVAGAARELGRSVAWFRKQAAVARSWTRKQIERAAARKNCHEITLPWSYFVELATIPDNDKRAEVFKEVLKEGMSVSNLKSRLTKDGAEKPVEPAGQAAKTPEDQPAPTEVDGARGAEASGDDAPDEAPEVEAGDDEQDDDELFASNEDSDEEINVPDAKPDPINETLSYFDYSGEICLIEECALLEFLSQVPPSAFTEDQFTDLQVIALETKRKVVTLLDRNEALVKVIDQIDSARKTDPVDAAAA